MPAIEIWRGKPNPNSQTTTLLFVIDFDGTLSTKDTVDSLLEHFAPETWRDLEEAWLAGRINAQQCMQAQLRLVEATPDIVEDFFRQIQLDAHFKDFLAHVESFAEVAVISDGLDHAIHVALENNGLNALPVYANRLRFVPPNRLDLEFPFLNADCAVGNGVCKCAIARTMASRCGGPIVLVGDGKSDACLAHKADVVFAKGSLIRYCVNNNIPHIPFDNFADVLTAVQTWETPCPVAVPA